MKLPAVKAILTSVMALAFLLLALTGALLYFGKTGIVWGVSRFTLRGVHSGAAITMCVLTLTHFLLNRRVYSNELRILSGKKKERGGSGGEGSAGSGGGEGGGGEGGGGEGSAGGSSAGSDGGGSGSDGGGSGGGEGSAGSDDGEGSAGSDGGGSGSGEGSAGSDDGESNCSDGGGDADGGDNH